MQSIILHEAEARSLVAARLQVDVHRASSDIFWLSRPTILFGRRALPRTFPNPKLIEPKHPPPRNLAENAVSASAPEASFSA